MTSSIYKSIFTPTKTTRKTTRKGVESPTNRSPEPHRRGYTPRTNLQYR